MFSTLYRALTQRGVRRRQAIVDLLARNPAMSYTEREICMVLQSWSGVVHADLQLLVRRKKVMRDEFASQPFYRIRLEGEGERA